MYIHRNYYVRRPRSLAVRGRETAGDSLLFDDDDDDARWRLCEKRDGGGEAMPAESRPVAWHADLVERADEIGLTKGFI